jgi:N-methylhydantoinase A/oxoprolinase/acetone carboxylase beta subunit
VRALALCGADFGVVRTAVLSAMQVSVSAGAGERLEVKRGVSVGSVSAMAQPACFGR